MPLPEELRADATVFFYDESGERVVLRTGTNHVECQPKHVDGYTRCSSTSSSERTDFTARMTAQGMSGEELQAALDEAEMNGFGASIEDHLPQVAHWVVAERLHYDIKANWKVVYDNFSEAYHIPVAHPKLALVLEQEMVEFREEKRWTFNRFKSKQGFPGLELDYGSPYYAWQAWPHLCMLSLPGSENLIVLRMAPDGVGACAERVDIYTPAGEAERHPKLQAVRDLFMDMFNIEDISIAESVQRGLSSMGYDQGRYVCDPSTSWFSEIQLHWFHMQVLAALQADQS